MNNVIDLRKPIANAPKLLSVGTRYLVKQSKRIYECIFIETVRMGNSDRITNYLYHVKSEQTGKRQIHNNHWVEYSLQDGTFKILS